MKEIADPAQPWISAIAQYEREFKKWESRTDKIIKRYRDEQRSQSRDSSAAKFNILWSNVQTAVPAVYSRLPKPDVSRRHRDSDPVGRVAALILERGLEFEVDHYPDYRAAMRNCVQDRFLGGRGVAWVRYEPHIKQALQITEDADEHEDTEQQGEAPEEELETESAPTDYVHWKDFGHTIARTWEEVTAVWRRVYLGRSALVERFGEEWGNKIPLDTKPPEKKGDSTQDVGLQAVIFEIWDKSSRTALWLSKSLGKIVDEKPDPLGLENFWPCPRPLFATLTTDSLVPVPDFALYQDQANTLDLIAERIDGLIRALQVKGVHNAEFPVLARLFSEASNTDLIPVDNWAAFSEKNGLKGAIDLVDLTPIFNALKAAYEAAEQQKNQVYEITGLADIIRGSTDPNETATAQKMKGQFGSMRLRSMQNQVSEFASELLQIKAQIMCREFAPETLAKIAAVQTLQPADQQYIQPALQLLKNSTLRDFRIEVASDSMIEIDEQQEKSDRMEFLKETGAFMQKAFQVITESPQIAPLVVEMLKFGVTGFKVGKGLEGVFDEVLDKVKQQAQQPQQPKQDPAVVKAQLDAKNDQKRMGMEQQAEQQRMTMEAQQKEREQQQEMALEQFRAKLQQQTDQSEQAFQAQQNQQQQALENQRAQMQAHIDAALASSQQKFDLLIASLNNRAKVEVAEINKASAIEGAQISAAQAASAAEQGGPSAAV